MLIVLGGLPGTGKSTIAKALASRIGAAYVRIDAIEAALRIAAPGRAIGAEGYSIAFAVTASNLTLGTAVVADSVNPVPESREGWRDVAHRTGVPLIEVEVVCSDAAEHRRRVETRVADIEGLTLPGWAMVQSRDYAPRTDPRLVLDTAVLSGGAAVDRILGEIRRLAGANRPPEGR